MSEEGREGGREGGTMVWTNKPASPAMAVVQDGGP